MSSSSAWTDSGQLRAYAQRTKDRIAKDPFGPLAFHCGPAYAAAYLHYDHYEIAMLPVVATARFRGVGNPLRIGPIAPGQVVLDHACGAGMDVLLAASRTGPRGRVIGVEQSALMRQCAVVAAREAMLDHIVEVRAGEPEQLPIDDRSIDVVLSNGAMSVSDRKQALQQMARVLKPGGRLYLADVVVGRQLSQDVAHDPECWAACIGGAVPEPELLKVVAQAGLVSARLVERFDCFRNTRMGQVVPKELCVHAVNLYCEKPH